MQARLSVADAVIQPQMFKVQISHIAVGSKDVMIVTDGAVCIHIQVTSLVGAGGIHIGITATQPATCLDVAVVGAIIAHTSQIDSRIGPCAAAIGEIKAVAAGINTAGQIPDIILGQKRLDREIVECGIHIVILVAHVIVAITSQGAATS